MIHASHTGWRRAVFVAAFGALSAANAAVAADYTFAVEPDYPIEQVQRTYKPLMDYLIKATGQHFTLTTSRNYHFYWRDIQAGAKPDFAFDEAHLAAYRISKAQYEPLVRAAEPTSYSLVTNLDGAKGPGALVGHGIASMSAPSLGYTVLLEFYPNPVSQPDIHSSQPAWKDAVEAIFAGDVDGAIIPTSLKDQFPNLTVLKTSRQFPGQCVTASPSVPAEVKDKVREALLNLDTANEEAAKLLFEVGVNKLVPATAKEYEGADQMLKTFAAGK